MGFLTAIETSNVTGRHRSPKRKLRIGYRAPSRRRRAMCRYSYVCLLDVPGLCNARHIFHRRVSKSKVNVKCHNNLRTIVFQSFGGQTDVDKSNTLLRRIAGAHGKDNGANAELQ